MKQSKLLITQDLSLCFFKEKQVKICSYLSSIKLINSKSLCTLGIAGFFFILMTNSSYANSANLKYYHLEQEVSLGVIVEDYGSAYVVGFTGAKNANGLSLDIFDQTGDKCVKAGPTINKFIPETGSNEIYWLLGCILDRVCQPVRFKITEDGDDTKILIGPFPLPEIRVQVDLVADPNNMVVSITNGIIANITIISVTSNSGVVTDLNFELQKNETRKVTINNGDFEIKYQVNGTEKSAQIVFTDNYMSNLSENKIVKYQHWLAGNESLLNSEKTAHAETKQQLANQAAEYQHWLAGNESLLNSEKAAHAETKQQVNNTAIKVESQQLDSNWTNPVPWHDTNTTIAGCKEDCWNTMNDKIIDGKLGINGALNLMTELTKCRNTCQLSLGAYGYQLRIEFANKMQERVGNNSRFTLIEEVRKKKEMLEKPAGIRQNINFHNRSI